VVEDEVENKVEDQEFVKEQKPSNAMEKKLVKKAFFKSKALLSSCL